MGVDKLPGLVEACDEVSVAVNGLDGMLALIADNKNKEIRMQREALYYAIEPQLQRMRSAHEKLRSLCRMAREARHEKTG